MPKRLISIVFALILFFGFVAPVGASVRLRAVQANPVGSDETEWIAVEHTGSASISGTLQLQDVFGGVKKFSQSTVFLPNELRVFPKSLTGISLNNDQEQVIATWQVGTTLATESSALLSSVDEGYVWWQDCQGEWQKDLEAGYQERATIKSWCLPTPSPTPTPTATPASLNSPTATPLLVASATPTLPQEDGPVALFSSPKPFPHPSLKLPFRVPVLGSNSATFSAKLVSSVKPPVSIPSGLTAEQAHQEVQVFLAWKKRALIGSLLLLWGGCVWLSLAVLGIWQLLYSKNAWQPGSITSLRWDPP